MPFAFIIDPFQATTSFFCAILQFFSSFLHIFTFIIFISYPFITVAFEVHFLFRIKSPLTSLLYPILPSFALLTLFVSFSSFILVFIPLLLVLIATYLQIPLYFYLNCHSFYFIFTLLLFYSWLKLVKLITALNSLPLVQFTLRFSLIRTFLFNFISMLIHFSSSSFRTSPPVFCYPLHSFTISSSLFLLSLRFISLSSILLTIMFPLYFFIIRSIFSVFLLIFIIIIVILIFFIPFAFEVLPFAFVLGGF